MKQAGRSDPHWRTQEGSPLSRLRTRHAGGVQFAFCGEHDRGPDDRRRAGARSPARSTKASQVLLVRDATDPGERLPRNQAAPKKKRSKGQTRKRQEKMGGRPHARSADRADRRSGRAMPALLIVVPIKERSFAVEERVLYWSGGKTRMDQRDDRSSLRERRGISGPRDRRELARQCVAPRAPFLELFGLFRRGSTAKDMAKWRAGGAARRREKTGCEPLKFLVTAAGTGADHVPGRRTRAPRL